MSGPKRGYWRFTYDSTPQRLRDLTAFVRKQDTWLERHEAFIRQYLGPQALTKARAARRRVDECIRRDDPDAGFDAYGKAWSTFNRLHKNAVEARRQQHREEQLRRGRLRQHRLRCQQAADQSASECVEEWNLPAHQALLLMWTGRDQRQALEAELKVLPTASPERVPALARSWQERLAGALRSAQQKAAENARAVCTCIPQLREALGSTSQLNLSVLPDDDSNSFEDNRKRLQEAGERALSTENLRSLRSVIGQLRELAAQYDPKIRAAELVKAAEIWRTALARCGYSVSSRNDADGTVVLQASSFPLKTVSVEVRADTEEVRLDVGGGHDATACIKDVQALQVELAREGIELTMTDWGKGRPGSVQRQVDRGISIGGGM